MGGVLRATRSRAMTPAARPATSAHTTEPRGSGIHHPSAPHSSYHPPLPMLRLPLTLWRLILLDLLKLVALSASVLVTVIAFGAAIKPLSDGKLETADALKFVLLAIPPMLAYALPFAAGFGATLVYYRIAQDNEAQAAYAGGVSHRRLLIPALGAALVFAAFLALLNEQVVPRFLQRMQRLITVDVARLLAQQITKGKSVAFGNMLIWADEARAVEPDPASGATDQVLLARFGVVEVGDDGKPVRE